MVVRSSSGGSKSISPPHQVADRAIQPLSQWREHGRGRFRAHRRRHQLGAGCARVTQRRHLELDRDQSQLLDGARTPDAAVTHERNRLAVELREEVIERVLQPRHDPSPRLPVSPRTGPDAYFR
jgi:hypothetical protein